ncbi:uncharacterized protein N0V96_007130 [Colletotrichum fioriniae]|uniref:uncharacterized protein n=1 Tax=Colletotrichum fioriniae TaxID=710243 RepID=UPI0032D9BC93|nr:hypothetical protein N0V96_007130 [Colletotrichum fioriniae]
MTTQQVFRLPRRTSINDLVVEKEPIPEPSSNEVLVRIHSVALNFRDFAVATGQYPFPVKDNVVPGSDLSGDVVKVGSHVDDFAHGDKVISSFDLSTFYGAMKDWNHSLGGCVDGALREYIVVPRTGGVSITGLILAKAAGATTILTSSSDSKLKHVKETYGPDHVINYKTTPKWSEEVLRITKGHGADYIFENGGAGTIAESISAVAYGGSIAVIGFLASCPQAKMPDVAALALSKGAVVRGIMVGSRQHLEEVTRYVVTRQLQVPVEKEFGSSRDEIIAAFEYLTSGSHIGKVCIRMA